MNDFLRRKMGRAICHMRRVGFRTDGFLGRNCEFIATLPWPVDDCRFTTWEMNTPIILSPDRLGIAFKQGKGYVIVYRRAECAEDSTS